MQAGIQAQVDTLIIGTYAKELDSSVESRPAWHKQTAPDVLHVHSRENREQRTFGDTLGHYNYIPYDPVRFVHHMQIMRRLFPGHTHFVDVGCGIGDKLLLAKQLAGFDKVSGVEYDVSSYNIARRTVGDISEQLIHGDAHKVSFAPFSVIYMYCPIRDEAKMRALYVHVARSASEGAVIVETYPVYTRGLDTKRFDALFEKHPPVHGYGAFVHQKINGKLHYVDIAYNDWNGEVYR